MAKNRKLLYSESELPRALLRQERDAYFFLWDKMLHYAENRLATDFPVLNYKHITSVAYMEVIEQLENGGYSEQGRFYSYIKAVHLIQCKSALKPKKRDGELPTAPETFDATEKSPTVKKTIHQDLASLFIDFAPIPHQRTITWLQSKTDRDIKILECFFLLNKNAQQIATHLDMPSAPISTQLSRLLRELRKLRINN